MNGLEKTNFISLEEFKSRARDGNAAGLALRKQYISEIKVPDDDEDELVLQFAISTGVEDRDRDTINPKGWDLKNYKKNPVVLWAHNYWTPPIAQGLKVWVKDEKLKAIVKFTDEDLYPFGYMIYRMCKAGFLNATSVGFRPSKWEDRRNDEGAWVGYNFLKQELLEFSIVPVPSNPEALIEARSAGIDTEPMVDWAKQILNGEHGEAGIWVPRKQLEGIVSLLEPGKTIAIPEKDVEDPDKPVEIEETVEEPIGEPEEIKETEPTETTAPAEDAVEREAEDVVDEIPEPSAEDEEPDKTEDPPEEKEAEAPTDEPAEGEDASVDPIEQLRAEIAELKGLVMGLVKGTEETEESTGDESETIEESTDDNEEVLFELAEESETSSDEVEDEGDDDVIDLAAIDDLGEVIEAAVRDALNQARGRLD